ncbi:MAG: putative mucin/carbohydrate-binding domain-containing protein [Culicoidibacterales bacterium]
MGSICVCLLGMTSTVFFVRADEQNGNRGDVPRQEATYVQTQTLYTNKNAQHLRISKGVHHDRQYPGVFLQTGQIIQARQVNPNFHEGITFELLADDAKKEVQGTIPPTGEYVRLIAKADSVPFVRTPITDNSEQPIIEYVIERETKELPIYVEGEDEGVFRDTWLNTQSPYAIFDSRRAIALVPLIDQMSLLTTFQSSLANLANFYNETLDQYDRFAGLEANSDNPLDVNVVGKYFLKANASGAGWGYYSGNHVGQNAQTMSGLLGPGHGLYHELGHGYDIHGDDIDLAEMWTNIYSHYMEIKPQYGVIPWLNGDSLDNSEQAGYVSYRPRLQFFINLFDFIGPEKAMSSVNRAYRQAMATGGVNMPMTEFLIRTLSAESGYNVASYFEHWGFRVSQDIKQWSLKEGFKQMIPLQYLYGKASEVGAIEKVQQSQEQLKLANRYTIVSNEMMREIDETADLNLTFNINDLSELQGRTVIIYDGEQEVTRQTIQSERMTFQSIQLGQYTLKVPKTQSGLYQYDELRYVSVGTNRNDVQVDYEQLHESAYKSGVDITVLGLGNNWVATMKYDRSKQHVTIHKGRGEPHVYFNQTYFGYKIRDAVGNIISEIDFSGQFYDLFDTTVEFKEGYQLELFHAEAATRLKIQSKVDAQIMYTQANGNDIYTIREGAFVKVSESQSNSTLQQQFLQQYLDNLITQYGIDEARNRVLDSRYANVVTSTIAEWTDEQKQAFVVKNNMLFTSVMFEIPTRFQVQVGEFLGDVQASLEAQMHVFGNGEIRMSKDWSAVFIDEDQKVMKPGEYSVMYHASDYFGLAATQQIQIEVVDREDAVESETLEEETLTEGSTEPPSETESTPPTEVPGEGVEEESETLEEEILTEGSTEPPSETESIPPTEVPGEGVDTLIVTESVGNDNDDIQRIPLYKNDYSSILYALTTVGGVALGIWWTVKRFFRY